MEDNIQQPSANTSAWISLINSIANSASGLFGKKISQNDLKISNQDIQFEKLIELEKLKLQEQEQMQKRRLFFFGFLFLSLITGIFFVFRKKKTPVLN